MGYQPSSTSSEQNPGPMASISPNEPAGGGSAMFDRSTSSTETDERIALSRDEFRRWSRASAGSSSVFSTASITFGPPGWQTHVEMSAGVRPWSLRKLRTSSPKYFSATVATSVDHLIWKPLVPIFQPITSSVSG